MKIKIESTEKSEQALQEALNKASRGMAAQVTGPYYWDIANAAKITEIQLNVWNISEKNRKGVRRDDVSAPMGDDKDEFWVIQFTIERGSKYWYLIECEVIKIKSMKEARCITWLTRAQETEAINTLRSKFKIIQEEVK